MSVIILTTGQPGAGKSYSRVRWLVTDYLVNTEGLYITNLSLKPDAIADYLSKKTGKDRDYYLNRIVVIPDEELKAWRDLKDLNKNDLQKIKDDSGFRFGEYMDQFDLSGAHIAIDEFHRYCSKTDPVLLRRIWNDWFAEVRKLGCTFEAITQDISQLPRDFFGKVGEKIDLAPFGNTRDPFFHIKMYDWYQLRGGLTGIIEQSVEQVESIKEVSNSGAVSWKETKRDRFSVTQEYFQFYNSFQKSDNSDKVQDFSCPALKYKKRIVFWFLRRNWFPIVWRFAVVIFFFWLCFGGGLTSVITGFTSTTAKISKSNGVDTESNSKQEVKAPNSVRRLVASTAPASAGSVESGEGVGVPVGQDGQPVPAVPPPPPPDYTPFQPALFLDGSCYLRNGLKIMVGYKFKGGVYDGKTVVGLDVADRAYSLDDGTISHMY